jgi:TPR repeat protein
MMKTCLAVLLTYLVSFLPALGEDAPISEQLDKEERSLQGLEKRAEESMRDIAQEEQPHAKLAAFSSEMTKQSQELKAMMNFEPLRKNIIGKKKELAENKRISSSLRAVAESRLVESAKRLDQLQHRAATLQKRLEQLEQAADQWGAEYSQMRQIDHKEALEQLHKSIQMELKDFGPNKTGLPNQTSNSSSSTRKVASSENHKNSSPSQRHSFAEGLREASQIVISGSTLAGIKALIDLEPSSSAEHEMLMEQVGLAVGKLSTTLKEPENQSRLSEIASTLDKASELGSADAMILLGLMFANGAGVPKDFSSAFKLFESASKYGNADAIYYQGECLFLGKGTTINYDKAVKCFEEALQLECWRSADQLGVIYRNGLTGAPPNYEIAFRYFSIAADKNIPSAIFNLGVMIINGEGVKKNTSQGALLFKRAAMAGWQPAMVGYAKCLMHGIGVAKDSKEAAVWIERAQRKKE